MKTRTLIFLSLISFFSFFFLAATPVFGSTLTSPGDAPWGARNSYWANDGSGNFDSAFFDVGFPNFEILGSGVDIYTGTGGTASSGPGSYPNDPAAYFNGFTQGQPVTFTVTLTNNTGTRGADTFWFSASKVDSCAGFGLDTALTEKNLSDCSNASIVNGIMTNQTTLINTWNSRTYVTIDAGQPHTLAYTWTPPESGYYQFDFGSDDYADTSNCLANGLYNGTDCTGTGIPPSNTYAAGFIRVNQTCSVTMQGTASSTDNIPVSFSASGNGPGGQSRLWLERADGQVINPAPGNITPNYYNPNNYYLLNSCDSSTAACTGSATVTLPAGQYYTHCDVLGNPPCSGSPFCTYNGGSIDCSGWAACSNDDHKPLTVTSPASAPTIISLQIGNASSTQTNGFTGTSKTSGLTQSEGGSNWLNPMTITLSATQGTNPISQYYTAFYAQSAAGLTTQSNFLTDIQSRIQNNSKSAFLLAYGQGIKAGDAGNNYYVWDYALNSGNGNWAKLITGNPYRVCETNTDGSKNCSLGHVYYDVSPGSISGKWTVYLYKVFGGKNMFTAASVTDGTLATFKADCITSNAPGDCKLLTP